MDCPYIFGGDDIIYFDLGQWDGIYNTFEIWGHSDLLDRNISKFEFVAGESNNYFDNLSDFVYNARIEMNCID